MLRLLTSLGVIAASVIVIVVLVIPRFHDVQDLRLQETDLKEALANSERLQQSWDELLDRYNAISPNDLGELDVLMPNNVDNVKLLIEIDTLAQLLGLRIDSVEVQAVTDNNTENIEGAPINPAGAVDMNFTLAGGYTNFTTFINRIESSLRLMDIQLLDISTSENETGQLDYEYDLTLRTYWLRLQAATPPSAAGAIIPNN